MCNMCVYCKTECETLYCNQNVNHVINCKLECEICFIANQNVRHILYSKSECETYSALQLRM